MSSELKAITEEILHHELNRSQRTISTNAGYDRLWLIVLRWPRLDIKAIYIDPVRPADDLKILNTVG